MPIVTRMTHPCLLAVLLSLTGLVEPALAQSSIRTTMIGVTDGSAAGAATFITDDTVPVGGSPVSWQSKRIVLVFQTRALPANATVTGATLQMTCASMLDAADVRIKASYTDLVNGQQRDQDFRELAFGASTPGQNGVARWAADPQAPWLGAIKGGDTITLRLALEPVRLPSGRKTREWYSYLTKDAAQRPRLILEYTVPGRPQPDQAVGLAGVLSPARFLPTVTVSGPMLKRKVHVRPFADVKPLSFAPAFGSGLVYMTVNDGLQARTPLTGENVWPAIPLENAGRHLVASPSGRLYVVGNDRIYVYRLDPSNPRAPAAPERAADGSWTGVLKVQSELRPEVAPAVGPDGSLYIFTAGQIVGGQNTPGQLVARNPDLQELWAAAMGDDKRISPITVGPSGRFVYLISAAEGLVAFDTATGDRLPTGNSLSARLPNQSLVRTYGDPALLAPVVTRESDGMEQIYAAANVGTLGSLTLFSNVRTRTQPPDAGLKQIWTSDSAWSQLLPNPATSPVSVVGIRRFPDTNRWAGPVQELFSVAELKTPTGAMSAPGQAVSTVPRERGKASDLDDSAFTPLGRPVIDRAGSLIVWNNKGNALQVFPPSAGLTRLEATGASFPSAPRLLFGSDGTLYAQTQDDRALHVILPEVVLGGQAGVNVQSPTHLRVSGSSGPDTTLSASGSIVFAPGTSLSGPFSARAGQPAQP